MSDRVLTGLFDDRGDGSTSRVKYNEGVTGDSEGEDNVVHALVTHVIDQDNVVLATWANGVLTQVNEGNPVPRRSKADYGPEGGGVTWDF